MGGSPRTALVLCGGGSRGAAEIGLYQALCELGVRVDLVVGTSIGAVNGAFIAAGASPDEMKRLWLDFPRRRPFRWNRELLWKGLAARSLLDPSGFKRFLEHALPVRRFEDLRIPLTIVATDLQEGESLHLEQGDLVVAIMTSTALPLYFPPVLLDGRQVVDGGVTNNVPLDVALRKGARRIFAMLCRCKAELERPVSGLLNIETRAFQIATQQRLRWDLERLGGQAEIVVLEPCLASARNVLDFRYTEEILEEGYRHARSALERNGGACGRASAPPDDASRTRTHSSG